MKTVYVVAAVIFDQREQNVLVSQRHACAHQGGLWEFPGGKVEQGESSHQALQREIKEEIDLAIKVGPLLHKEQHQYSDKHVTIEFYCVYEYSGEPKGVEGQLVEWVPMHALSQRVFPAANNLVIQKICERFLA